MEEKENTLHLSLDYGVYEQNISALSDTNKAKKAFNLEINVQHLAHISPQLKNRRHPSSVLSKDIQPVFMNERKESEQKPKNRIFYAPRFYDRFPARNISVTDSICSEFSISEFSEISSLQSSIQWTSMKKNASNSLSVSISDDDDNDSCEDLRQSLDQQWNDIQSTLYDLKVQLKN